MEVVSKHSKKEQKTNAMIQFHLTQDSYNRIIVNKKNIEKEILLGGLN